jgi:RNA recognition motif-containing protein
MSRKVFAGNLSFKLSRDDLLEVFGSAGAVVDVVMPLDRVSGRPRGFAFVEYEKDEDAAKAVEILNGKEVGGRTLRVDEARERPRRPPREADRPPPQEVDAWFPPADEALKTKGSRRGLRRRKRGFY